MLLCIISLINDVPMTNGEAVCSEMNLLYSAFDIPYATRTRKVAFHATAGDENDSVLAVLCDAELSGPAEALASYPPPPTVMSAEHHLQYSSIVGTAAFNGHMGPLLDPFTSSN